MKTINLKASNRQDSADGVRGVVYGPDLENNLAIAVEYNVLYKAAKEAGANKIINLEVDGESHEVLFKDFQFHPTTDDIIHFDMYAIKRGQKMRANIPVVLVGESPAAAKGAIVNQIVDELEVECVPAKLPEEFEVDISALEEVGDSVTTGDIKVDDEVEILIDDELTVAKAEEVREMQVEDDGPIDGPSEEEGEESDEESTGEASEGAGDAEAKEGDSTE